MLFFGDLKLWSKIFFKGILCVPAIYWSGIAHWNLTLEIYRNSWLGLLFLQCISQSDSHSTGKPTNGEHASWQTSGENRFAKNWEKSKFCGMSSACCILVMVYPGKQHTLTPCAIQPRWENWHCSSLQEAAWKDHLGFHSFLLCLWLSYSWRKLNA